MTGRAHSRHAGAGAGRAARHRDRPLARADRIALGIGIGLAVLMVAWLAWRLTQTIARDRAVAPGVAPAPVMPSH